MFSCPYSVGSAAVLSKGCVNYLTRNFNNLAVTHQRQLKRQQLQASCCTTETYRPHMSVVASGKWQEASWKWQVADATGGLCVPICTCQVPSGQVYIKYNKYLPQFMQRQWGGTLRCDNVVGKGDIHILWPPEAIQTAYKIQFNLSLIHGIILKFMLNILMAERVSLWIYPHGTALIW